MENRRIGHKQGVDAIVIDRRQIKGVFNRLFLSLYQHRTYQRNDENPECFVWMVILALATFGITLAYKYSPIHFVLSDVFYFMQGCMLYLPILYANRSQLIWFINFFMGFAGLHTHYQFGFSFFGYHLEPCLYALYIISSMLTLLRRELNSLIWYKLTQLKMQCLESYESKNAK